MLVFYKRYLWIVCFCFITPLKAQTLLTLESASTTALSENPNLAQINARLQAMQAIIPQRGALPDPEISFNALNLPVDSFDIGQENMTQMQFGITQKIPFPTKLALREQVATDERKVVVESLNEARLQLVSDVKQQWWLIFYLDRVLNIIDSTQILLRQFVEIARTKYEVGEGLQQDVLLAQLELSKLLDQKLIWNSQREKAVAALNTLLNLPANQVIVLPDTVVAAFKKLRAENQLYQQAQQFRAALASGQQQVQVAKSRLQLAEEELYPDFKIGAFYGGRDDTLQGNRRDDFLSMKLSVTVPIFADSKQNKAIQQRKAEVLQSVYALQDLWNQVRKQISTAYSDYRRSTQQIELFEKGIIPQARQTVASMLSGYQVNQVDFLNLVRSEITLFNYEMQYWHSFVQAHQALATLNAVVGQESLYE
ncbi:MAG: transporter [Methylococcaceae bacterium]|nr:transporter [Methylococcaceae bacterium]